MILRLIIFFVINFAALGIGGLFTKSGVASDWYQTASKAPWTPPGWAFGAAWTTIMLLLTVFMAHAWSNTEQRKFLLILFAVQWILNVSWCAVFFKYHLVFAGLVIILALLFLLIYMMSAWYSELTFWTLLILPYILWLMVATSLNAYILLKN